MRKKVLLNDVCLRESAQVSNGAMSPRDQSEYVRLLLKGGIDAIEIGFPGSSEEQMKQCRRIVQFVESWNGNKKPILSGLARATKADIDAVKTAGCDMVHIYIPASDEFLLTQFDSEKYGDSPEGKRKWVIERAIEMVEYAKSIGFEHIQYTPEDSARTERIFLVQIIKAVIDAGVTRVNIADTTGLRVLSEFGELIAFLFDNIEELKSVVVSVHCHNDSGCANANALQSINAGVSQIEGTFYGLGERSGMTAFESIIMNINSRRDVFSGVEIDFDSKMCVTIVNHVANALGMSVPRHWVVVGAQNAIVSSGTHQLIEARAKQQGKSSAYYSWDPKVYGHKGLSVEVTQSSGRDGLLHRLVKLGFNIKDDQIGLIFEKFKDISTSKNGSPLNDRELAAVVQDAVSGIPNYLKIIDCQAIGGSGTLPTATVKMEIGGVIEIAAGIGNGPYNAIMNAVHAIVGRHFPQINGLEIELDNWHAVSLGKGSDAVADAYARIGVSNGVNQVHVGRSVHPDTNQASAQAFANCYSWLLESIL
ncbi:alpha-isopropylmalate synthase regulatory domain-containing protein [Patescibacteria group bacterium]